MFSFWFLFYLEDKEDKSLNIQTKLLKKYSYEPHLYPVEFKRNMNYHPQIGISSILPGTF